MQRSIIGQKKKNKPNWKRKHTETEIDTVPIDHKGYSNKAPKLHNLSITDPSLYKQVISVNINTSRFSSICHWKNY